MSTRVEWMDASPNRLSIVGGDEYMPDGNYIGPSNIAMVASQDDVFVIEGSPAKVREMLVRALAELDAMMVDR